MLALAAAPGGQLSPCRISAAPSGIEQDYLGELIIRGCLRRGGGSLNRHHMGGSCKSH